MQKPIEAMRLNFNQPLRVSQLAELAGMSVSNFFRNFKRMTGLPPSHYRARERAHKAHIVEETE